jgi:hypothetical protein
MTNLNHVFQRPEFKLPYWISESIGSFPLKFDEKTGIYLEMLKALPNEAFYHYDKEMYLEKASLIVFGLSDILSVYLDGLPSKAFILFKELMEKVDLTNDLVYFRTKIIAGNSRFYRVKKEYNPDVLIKNGHQTGINEKYDVSELFHVPFNKRKSVGTNRFSIPGFPCLYLSESLVTSWSECIEDAGEKFHAISYSNLRPLYIADISPFEFTCEEKETYDGKDYLYQQDLDPSIFLSYGHLFPLVLACHSKVEYVSAYNGEVKFKSEYIVPQLLLQWFKENGILVDGIRYLSCTANKKFGNNNLSPFNYVLPVQQLNEMGHCNNLLHMFTKSPVYSCLDGLASDKIFNDLCAIQNQLSERSNEII